MDNTYVLVGFGIFGLIALLYMVFIQNKKQKEIEELELDDDSNATTTSYDADSEVFSG